ncbi:MAG: DUF1223 domain-containing protein [Gammaproteobacteria bacterium]
MNRRSSVRLVAAALVMLGYGVTAQADKSLTFESGLQQTALIELYTSEGCSSCPPADRWFSELSGEQGLWTDYVPLAFHVTYWNYLGWRDGFSDEAYDQRQRRRAAAADSGVYTPGVFLDGDEFRGWRRLRSGPSSSNSQAAGRLQVDVDQGEIRATFDAQTSAENLRVEVAVLSSGLTSKVRAGENRGRSLAHDFVVTSLTAVAMAREGEQWVARVDLPATQDISRPALAVWVSDAQGEPLQATGGWLH